MEARQNAAGHGNKEDGDKQLARGVFADQHALGYVVQIRSAGEDDAGKNADGGNN